jgi:hypothetical protein
MKRTLWMLGLFAIAASGAAAFDDAGSDAGAETALEQDGGADAGDAGIDAGPSFPAIFNFQDDIAGYPPRTFLFRRTGKGAPAHWIVRELDGGEVPDAGDGGERVLAQIDTEAGPARTPIAIVDRPWLKDGLLSVRCRPLTGTVDQGCGLVFRYVTEKSYYLARLNALAGTIRLDAVRYGALVPIASVRRKFAPGVWHQLQVQFTGDHLVVTADGKKALDVRDPIFLEMGRFGVSTRGDAVTEFDDLVAELPDGGQP